MKKLTLALAVVGLVTATSAFAVVRGSAAVSVYPLGGGQCLYFQSARFWIAPC